MAESLIDVRGQAALVTGASRGIGEAVARNLHDRGANVFGTATTEQGAQTISSRLGRDRGIQVDFGDWTDIDRELRAKELVEASRTDDGGPLLLLVLNAGVTSGVELGKPQKLGDIYARQSADERQRMRRVNMDAPEALIHASMQTRAMRAGGRVAISSSMTTEMFGGRQAVYAGTKSFFNGLAGQLQVENSGLGLSVVRMGLVSTDMTSGMSQETIDEAARLSTLGRAATPDEAAEFIVGQMLRPTLDPQGLDVISRFNYDPALARTTE